MTRNWAKIICVNAVVAALYAVLTMPFGIIAVNSTFQFRPAEALTILPALAPYTVIGLTIGCAISNTVSAFGISDVVLGSLVTLLAGWLTSTKLFKKFFLAPVPPVVLNALLLPLIWMLADPTGITYWLSAGALLLTQGAVIFGLGIPLYFFTQRRLLPLISLDDNV